jgi:exonuclease III
MGFAKKRELLYKLSPDIAVISECSRDSMILCKEESFDSCWWGENKNKGLGVLAQKPWTLEPFGKPGLQPRQKWIAPVRVRGPLDFLLIAVWAGRVGNVKEMNYVGQVYQAVETNPSWFTPARPIVICGDFNSNAIWDSERKIRNHSALVRLMRDRHLVSAYHSHASEQQGKETRYTHFHRFSDEPRSIFHIDYIFLPETWRVENVEIGTYEQWCRSTPRSDHAPVVVDVRYKD